MLPIPGWSRRGASWLATCVLLGLGLRTAACWAWSHQLREDRDLYVLLARQLASGLGYTRPWQLQYDTSGIAEPPPVDRAPVPGGEPSAPSVSPPVPAPTPPPPVAPAAPTPGTNPAVPPRFGLGSPVLSPAEGGGGPAWEFTPRRERELPAPHALGVINLPTAYRPPLYPLVLASVLKVRDTPAAIGALNLLLGGATLVAVAIAAGRVGRVVGSPVWMPLLAVGLVACDPLLVAQAPLAMTETLAACLVAMLLAVVASPVTDRRSLLAGVLVGLLALCRPTFLASAAVWGACASVAHIRRWVAEGGPRVPLGTLLGVCGGLAVTLLPWGVRNQWQFGRPIVTTSHGGYTLRLAQNPRYAELVSLNPDPSGWRAYNRLLEDEGYAWMFTPEPHKGAVQLSRSSPGRLSYSGPVDQWEIASDAALQRLALDHLRESIPRAWATARSLLGRLWSPWPRQADSWPAAARWALGVEQLLLFAAAAAGLWTWGRSAGLRVVGGEASAASTEVETSSPRASPELTTHTAERPCEPPGKQPEAKRPAAEQPTRSEAEAVAAVGRVAVALLISFTLVHAFYWADMRMRAPLVPVLALLAARAGAALCEKWPGLESFTSAVRATAPGRD